MTTILYCHKSKQVAVDSRTTAGSLLVTDEAIKWKEADGRIYFFAGAVADQVDLIGLKNNDKVDPAPDCDALVIEPNGDVYLMLFVGNYVSYGICNNSRAIGSGSSFALSSLDHGRCAGDAIAYAGTRDLNTGGKSHVFDIGKMEWLT